MPASSVYTDRVAGFLVAEVVLQRPGVVAVVREFEPTGVAQHVRVSGNKRPAARPARVTSLRTLLRLLCRTRRLMSGRVHI